MSTLKGKVKFFNHEKGFGFIKPDDGSADVFLHRSALEDSHLETVEDGADVQFDKVENPRSGKFQAEKIEILN